MKGKLHFVMNIFIYLRMCCLGLYTCGTFKYLLVFCKLLNKLSLPNIIIFGMHKS